MPAARADTASTGTPWASAATSATNARRIVDEIRLVEDDDRGGAALPRGHQVALDPARIEIVIEPGNEKHHIDVRRHHLLLSGIAGGAPREADERGSTARMRASPPPAGGLDDDPVADGGKGGAAGRLMTQPARDAGKTLPLGRDHAIDVRMLQADTRGRHAVGTVRRERLGKPGGPAQILERQRHVTLHRKVIVLPFGYAVTCQRSPSPF